MAFRSIGHRILVLVGGVVAVGLLTLVFFYTQRQEHSTLAQNERVMRLFTRGVIQGVQTAMLSGHAEIVEDYVARLRQVPGLIHMHVLRLDGQEAFYDNRTILEVNERVGSKVFMPRQEPAEAETILAPEQVRTLLDRPSNNAELPVYETDGKGESLLSFLAPIPNQPECHGCHGEEMMIRGFVKLTTSLALVQQEIRQTRLEALSLLLVTLAIMLGVVWVLLKKTLVRPILQTTFAMADVAGGNLDRQVEVQGRDELSYMARSFNQMSAELLRSHEGLKQEQDKLTTIILSAREGIVVTDAAGKVVLVNPAAERLLGKSTHRIAEEGFLNILDDPDYLSTYLQQGGVDLPETLVFNNRTLNVYASTISFAGGEVIGTAALIRDVTEEKRLEEQLRQLSITDALTGLNNRRRFDELLTEEFERSKRYGLEMSLLLFDVDHFKRFNDEHGHEQGDRVLQAVGKVMRDHFRKVDAPCRYGGEEFCAIMPSTGIPGAQLTAERLRQKIEAMVVDGLKVTISIGVAVLPHSGADTPEEMLKMSDDALYAAKRGGRNQVKMALPNT
ncbi:MAG: diguanylate cyclase [Magnetococcales bacterium]|nr:diguanylate cyclase [Magnetococcales bacterium]